MADWPRRSVGLVDLLGRQIDSSSLLLGAFLFGESPLAQLVSVDVDGVLWELGLGDRRELVSYALRQSVRVFLSLGELVEALEAGQVVGLLPGFGARLGCRWQPAVFAAAADEAA